MTYEEYFIQAPVTLKSLPTLQQNITHMLFGLTGEIGEILDAIQKTDIVELKEELGDSFWFLTCYQKLWSDEYNSREETSIFDLTLYFPTSQTLTFSKTFFSVDTNTNSVVKNTTTKLYNKLFSRGGSILRSPWSFEKELKRYQVFVSELVDIEKREFIYNKPQDSERRSKLVRRIGVSLSKLCFYAGIELQEVYQSNINKLQKVRYKSGTYSDQQAVNRSKQVERDVLEGK